MAEIQLTNRGRTIPPEKLEHIFEQFYRVDSSRGSRTGGAGVDLQIRFAVADHQFFKGGFIVPAKTTRTQKGKVTFPCSLRAFPLIG